MADDSAYHLLSLGQQPGLTVGRATQLSGPPARPLVLPGTPPQRPVRDKKAVQSGELMGVPLMAGNLFEGDAPQVGDVVELVCVRADSHGWGLGLRVKRAVEHDA